MKSEVDLLRPVVQWLRDQRWEVFQEVQTKYGSRCDIVARLGKILWCIEGKLSLNLTVCAQCWGWRPYAHYISIAIPYRQSNEFAYDILRYKGVGVLRVIDQSSEYSCAVTEDVRPRLHRKIQGKLAKYLVAESQTYALAGNAACKFWSPWKQTVRNIHDALIASGTNGLTMKELVANIQHHYHCASTAKSSLNKWMRDGIVPDVIMVPDSYPTRWIYQRKQD